MNHPMNPCAAPRANSATTRASSGGEKYPRFQNTTNGTRKTMPMVRASSRWKYSQKKMNRNSSSVIPRRSCWYSGNSR